MKKLLTWLSIGIIFFSCVYAAVDLGKMDRTYNGAMANPSVYDLRQNPSAYDDTTANVDGAAAAIVQQNLDKTHAVNDVTSIVFDFRGYDTMGEAFILITAVAGATVILYSGKKEKKEESKDGK